MPFLLTYYSFCSKFNTQIQLEAGKLIAKLAYALEKGAAYRPLPDRFLAQDVTTIEIILTDLLLLVCAVIYHLSN